MAVTLNARRKAMRERYLDGQSDDRKVSDQMLTDILDAYHDLVARSEKLINDAGEDVYKADARKRLLQEVRAELNKFEFRAAKILKAGLLKVVKFVTGQAVSDMKAMRLDVPKSETFYGDLNRQRVLAAFSDDYSHVSAQTSRMHAQVKAQLQQVASQVMRRSAVEGISRKDAAKLLRAEMEKVAPDFQFVDRRGRRWKSEAYFSMLAETLAANHARETYISTLTAAGHDLVKLSSHGATDPCRGWEGRVLSLTGATPGYPTYEAAKATGEVFHPRCRHRLLAYHQESDFNLDDPED